jgi:3-methyladenine DNA glycosylase AlkD
MIYADTIRNWFIENATPNSKPPAGYTGSSNFIYGIRVPQMRTLMREWVKQHKDLSYDDWVTLLDTLYHGTSMDEHSVCGLLLTHYKQHRLRLPLAQFDTWLGCLTGWVEVDSNCQSTFTAAEVLQRWHEWQPFLQALAQDTNINKRRASLVILIRPLRESADEQLLQLALENVERLKAEKDKLITKAISWVLREATKQHRSAIEKYLNTNTATLPAIAVRETRTKLSTGTK